MNTVMICHDGEALPVIRPRALRRGLIHPATRSVIPLAGVLWLAEAVAQPAAATFDATTLQQRGIDPGLAMLLVQAPRFGGGSHPVTLSVNGRPKGRVNAHFTADGELCFDQSLLDKANLLGTVPDSDETLRCHDFMTRWPTTQIEQDTANLGLSLIVPTDALRPVVRDFSGYETGGFAGLINYDLTGLYSHYGDQTSRYGSANTEVGFNAGDWIVRSRQVQTWQDDDSRTTHLEAYAQRTFAQQQLVLQAGQINLYNPVLAGAQITGVQVLTEQALQEENQGSTIDGIAYSQAQVEVRQNGALIHSTVVPAGPFSLSDVRRLDSRSDVEVTVKEIDGSERRFTVPAAMLGVGLPAPGYSVAAGRVRDISHDQSAEPWVVSAGWSGGVLPGVNLAGGSLLADSYQAAGISLGTQLWTNADVQASLTATDARRHTQRRGIQTDLLLSQQLNDRWSFYLGTSQRTEGYRELQESIAERYADERNQRYRDQQSAGVAWSHPWMGAFSTGYSRSTLFDGRNSSRALATWGTRVGNVSVSASAEWQVSGSQGRDDSLYLNLSIPLGENRRARTWLRNSGGEHRIGVGLNEQLNDQLSYRAGVERDSRDRQVQSSLGVSALPRYTQLDLNYSRDDAERDSYQSSARGAVVMHGDGVTLSPYPVCDTFAVLSVADISGIKVNTPSGPVWTDWQGQAVVPQVSAYSRTAVEVETRTLPRNADINNGLAQITAGRGAVDRVDFGVSLTRRALLSVTTVDGKPLPRGASVSSANGEFITLVQDGGQVFLTNALEQPSLWVKAPGQPPCEVHYQLQAKPDTQSYYETAAAQCRTP